jgi:hypothetical protein
MAQNTNEVAVAVTGNIYSMPVGTVIEFDEIYTVPGVAKEHGYASADGITVSGSRSTTDITAWQNATLARRVVTESSVTFAFTLIQTNADNQELVYGATKNPVTGAYHWDAARTGGRRAWIFDIIDENSNQKVRYYVPSGEITELGEISLTSSDAIGYNITVTAYKVDIADEPANTLIWNGPATAPVAP